MPPRKLASVTFDRRVETPREADKLGILCAPPPGPVDFWQLFGNERELLSVCFDSSSKYAGRNMLVAVGLNPRRRPPSSPLK